MSEKITFKELIESIAEETDNSRQYTQDFVKNFVEIINDGLEEDGKVNIAGFGKFNLKRVDEREGFNPQTEEKITIPAHNKIIFKPYKNVRDLVNAPYAHLEPELLDEETKKDQGTTEEGSTDPADNQQNDFIPTGPPTYEEHQNDSEGLSDSLQEEENVNEDEDEDIVEFKPDKNDADAKKEEELNEFIGSSEQPDDQIDETDSEKSVDDEENQPDEVKDEKELIEETIFHTEELIDDSEDLLDSFEEDDTNEEVTTANDFNQDNERSKKNSSSVSLTIAAVVILLLTAGGVWYFSINTDENQPEMIAQETVSPSENVASTADEQSQSDDAESEGDQQSTQDQQQAQDQAQSQNQDTGSSSTSATSATVSSDSKSEGVEIEQGQTLWSLADEKYGNPRLWPWIYGNNEALEDPDLVYAGSSLSVPLPSGPDNTLNTADSVGVAKGFIATYQWYKDKNSSKAKDHLWGAKLYHDDIRSIADIDIDKADLKYANRAR